MNGKIPHDWESNKEYCVQNVELGPTKSIEIQQKLYQAYVLAAEAYVKKPTIYNWEKKEKAFEIYNALIKKVKTMP